MVDSEDEDVDLDCLIDLDVLVEGCELEGRRRLVVIFFGIDGS